LSSGQLGAALRELPEPTRDAAVRELSTIGAGLLDLEVGSLLVIGWRNYSALTDAARRTAEAPGSEEIVDIGNTASRCRRPPASRPEQFLAGGGRIPP
jgi:hypothetical protein